MALAIWYWIMIFLWLVLGAWGTWPGRNQPRAAYYPFGGNLVLFLLFVILGWEVFGSPVK